MQPRRAQEAFGSGSKPIKGSQHPSKQVAGRLAAWMRSLGVISTEVDPNHGWRHRMKRVARDLGLDPHIVDAIQGHAARTAGEAYGAVSLLAKARVICAIPSFGSRQPLDYPIEANSAIASGTSGVD